MTVTTHYKISNGEQFNFFGHPDKPLKIGDRVKIKLFRKRPYGAAEVTEILGKNEYRARRVLLDKPAEA